MDTAGSSPWCRTTDIPGPIPLSLGNQKCPPKGRVLYQGHGKTIPFQIRKRKLGEEKGHTKEKQA